MDDQTRPIAKHVASSSTPPPVPFPSVTSPVPPSSGGSGPTPPAPQNRRLVGLAAGFVVLLVAIAAVVFFVQRGDSGGGGETAALDTRPLVTTQLGVFRGTSPDKVREFGEWLGRDVTYAMDFSLRQTFADIAQPQTQIDIWKGHPYRMVYALAMLPENPADTLERGASGEYDKYYADLAHRLVAAGQDDAILRVGWEFNLESSRWSSDDPTAFIAYWRHIVTTMRAEPGEHFQFDWNPNNGDNKYDAVKYYPGSDVVDYIGVDAYDVSWASGAYPYPANCDTACRTSRQKVAWEKSVCGGARGLRFWSNFAKQQGKPMSLPEWGLWQREDQHGGGDDPDYLRRMSAFIAAPANRVAYQSYFEFDGPDGPHRLMTTFPESGELFRSLFAK